MRKWLFVCLLAMSGSASAQLVLSICTVNLPCPGFPLGSVQAPIDANGWRNFKLILTQNVTQFSFIGTPPPAQASATVIFTQDATGTRTVTFASNVTNPCTITATANATTLCQFEFDGTTSKWIGISAGSGGGIGPVTDAGGQVFNVKAYGALGNGSTDDSTAIQSAINLAAAAGTSAQAAQVYFPPSTGFYEICGATQLTVPSNVVLVGERGTTIQACSSLAVGKNMIQNSVWAAQSGTTTTTTPNLNFGVKGLTLDGNTAGRGTMSYYVVAPLTQTATCSMSSTTATCTPNTGTFAVTGLAAGMLLSIDQCANYFNVTWTIATVSSASITATSNPAGTSGLATQANCLIYNDFQGNNVAFHGYQYELYDVQLINSTNNCAYSEFGHIANVRVASTWNLVDKINCTNIGMVYVGPSDSNFLIDHSKQAGFEGNIFKQTLNTATNSANSAYGSYLQFTHNSKNGVTGSPGYGDEIDTLIYCIGCEDENQQHSGGIWVNCNAAACGNPNFQLVQSWGNTGDGITVNNFLSGLFNPSFSISGCQINGNSANGVNFSSITTNFGAVMVSNCNPFGNTTADWAWPTAATTASGSSVNIVPGTQSGTVPTGLTGSWQTASQFLGNNAGVQICPGTGGSTIGGSAITGTGAFVAIATCTIPAWCMSPGHRFHFATTWTHSTGAAAVTYAFFLGVTQINGSWSSANAGAFTQKGDGYMTVTNAQQWAADPAFSNSALAFTAGQTVNTSAVTTGVATTFNEQFNVAATDQITPKDLNVVCY